MIIESIIKDLNEYKNSLNKLSKKILDDNKEAVIDYIREKQLYEQGIDGKGKKLKPYSPFTVAVKKQKGEIYQHTTLLNEGKVYNKMDALFTDQNAIGVFSTDEKTPKLVEKYGASIFEFTKENIKEIDEKIFYTEYLQGIQKTISKYL